MTRSSQNAPTGRTRQLTLLDVQEAVELSPEDPREVYPRKTRPQGYE